MLTIVVLAVIFLTTLFFAVRTEGGRSFIEDRVERYLGRKMSIERTRIGFPCVLVMEGMRSKDVDSGDGSGLKVQELRIGLGMRTRWVVSAHRCELNLLRRRDGSWTPEVFGRLGDLPLRNVTEISRVTSRLRKNMRLRVSESSLRWLDGSGSEMASARGISLRISPVRVPDRKMYYYHLSAYNVVGADGTRISDVDREWLAGDTKDYIEIHRSQRGIPASGQEFWEPASSQSSSVPGLGRRDRAGEGKRE